MARRSGLQAGGIFRLSQKSDKRYSNLFLILCSRVAMQKRSLSVMGAFFDGASIVSVTRCIINGFICVNRGPQDL